MNGGDIRMRCTVLALPVVLALVAASPSSNAADAKELKAKYEGKSFVLQHNLHVDDNVAKWQNFIEGDFVPVGSKVTVTKIDAKKASLVFEDPTRTVRLDLDDAIPDAVFVLDRVLGATAPSTKGFGKTDLDGIKQGKILEGMTRKAVFLAVGPPPYSYTPPFRHDSAVNHDPKADELTYMKGTYDFLKVTFSKDKVADLED
jgi:hypothetical protein